MLYLVATPIGDIHEISLKALEILKSAEVIICESTKETSTLLKAHGIKALRYEILNEHSTPEDLQNLLELCKNKTAALVSDCGTPAFCDPGNDLIKLCRQNKVKVSSVLGASSLMGLLSLSSIRLYEFHFKGFLPAETTARQKAWETLKKEKQAIILMDTPYRLKKMIDECLLYMKNRNLLLALNLSQDNELILEGTPEHIKKNNTFEKAEFMLLIYPEV